MCSEGWRDPTQATMRPEKEVIYIEYKRLSFYNVHNRQLLVRRKKYSKPKNTRINQ